MNMQKPLSAMLIIGLVPWSTGCGRDPTGVTLENLEGAQPQALTLRGSDTGSVDPKLGVLTDPAIADSFTTWLTSDEGKQKLLAVANAGRPELVAPLPEGTGPVSGPTKDTTLQLRERAADLVAVSQDVADPIMQIVANDPAAIPEADPCDSEALFLPPPSHCLGTGGLIVQGSPTSEEEGPSGNGFVTTTVGGTRGDTHGGTLVTELDDSADGGGPMGPSGEAGDDGACPNFLVRYVCCDSVFLRATPSADADIIESLDAGEMIQVYDLVGTNWSTAGLNTATTNILAACGAGALTGANNPICGNALWNFAETTLPYWMEVVTEAGNTGYVPIGAGVMPFDETNTELHFQGNFGLLAEQAANGANRLVAAPGCGDGSNTWTAQTGPDDVVYFQTFAPQTYEDDLAVLPTSSPTLLKCDDAIACPTWTATRCTEDNVEDPAVLERCLFGGPTECNLHDGDSAALLAAEPDREPAIGNYFCVPNSCPGKGTCESCRQWFAESGQDHTGWKTEQELIEGCVADTLELYQVPVPCTQGPDLCTPPPCIGGQGPTCYDYCQATMQTHKVFECRSYISAFDSRTFVDYADYECGEYPVGVTHPNRWLYEATGEWSGPLDYDNKLLVQVPFLGRPVQIKGSRLPGQKPFSVSVFDLTEGKEVVENYGAALSARNIWVSVDPHEDYARAQVCMAIPGFTASGPVLEQLEPETYGLLHQVSFGSATFDKAVLCMLADVRLDADLKPRIQWIDLDYKIHGATFYGQSVVPGPGYLLAWGAGILLGPLQTIYYAALGMAGATVAGINIITNFTDFPTAIAAMVNNAVHHKAVWGAIARINEETPRLLAGLDPQVDARMKEVCNMLTPPVPNQNPLYYFYKWLKDQCTNVRTSLDVTPFHRNAGSNSEDCYGPEQLFTPDDHDHSKLREYFGQSWWFAGVDRGCRMEAVANINLDETLHGTLRCATAVLNGHINTGMTGSLAQKVSAACTPFGLNALRNKYGNGWDYAEMYLCKHPDIVGDELIIRD